MRVLVVGCGYVGLRLGAELIRHGHEVFGLRRSIDAKAELDAVGIQSLAGDITKPEDLARLPCPFDWVVSTVSSDKGEAEEYRRIYMNGMLNLITWLAPEPPRKIVYTSSTSVYGQTDGSAVKETSPTEPLSETSKILIAAEKLLINAVRDHRLPIVILRAAGIYGLGRGHLFRQFIRNEARIAGQGQRVINMIHVDDLVGIIIAALKHGRPGEVYNAVDDEPVTQIHFFRWLSETLGKWMPLFAGEPENKQRKRGLTNKKVQNRKLKMELGYQFKYPTFRQGYTAEIQRLERAGELNIEAEPR